MHKAFCASLLVLASCSSNGGSTSTSGEVTPRPTTTPTPSASPTGTPSPSLSYRTYAQLSGDQSFQTACVWASVIRPLPGPATRFGDGLLLAYTASSQTYGVTRYGHNLSFGPTNLDPATAGAQSYTKVENGFTYRFSIATPTAGGVGLDYARSFSLIAPSISVPTQYVCVFGVPTLLTDKPAASTVTFTRTGVTGTAYITPTRGEGRTYSLENSIATMTVDLTTGRATTTVRLIGTLQTASGSATTQAELGTFTGVGDFDETRQTYYGELTSTNRPSQFSYFGGWFFGPQGKEAIYAAEILSNDATIGENMTVLMTVAAAR